MESIKKTKTKVELTIINTPQPVTCSGDVVMLQEYTDGYSKGFLRNYELYKSENVYFLLVENDKYPVIIDQQQAESILKNPDAGAIFAANTWLNRYK